MTRPKRKPSSSPNRADRKKTRSNHEPDIVVGDAFLNPPEKIIYSVDDEDDLAAIVARIKEQEESEALARQLQHVWNGANASTDAAGPNGTNNDLLTDDNGEDDGSDEAMARRLALEWELEDQTIKNASTSSNSVYNPPISLPSSASGEQSFSTCLLPDDDDPPDVKLLQFRDFFTGTRTCTKCKKPVESPRGEVSPLSIETHPKALNLEARNLPGCIFV
jgi:hypothetical protein